MEDDKDVISEESENENIGSVKMFCSYCGKEMNGGYEFCTACGKSTCGENSILKNNKKQYCIYCGETLHFDASFCTRCGKAVQKEEKHFAITDELKEKVQMAGKETKSLLGKVGIGTKEKTEAGYIRQPNKTGGERSTDTLALKESPKETVDIIPDKDHTEGKTELDNPKETKSNAMAKWGFGLAIAGVFLIIVAPLALILNIFAIVQIRKRLERGLGFAVTGITISVITIILGVLIFAGFAPILVSLLELIRSVTGIAQSFDSLLAGAGTLIGKITTIVSNF